MVVQRVRRWSVRWLRQRHFDVDAAVVGVLLAAALFPLRFLSSDVYIETIPLVLGGACLVYLFASYQYREATLEPTLPASVVAALPAAVLVGVATLVVVATLQGRRTIVFYLIAGIVGTLLLAQILFTPEEELNPRYVLGEVVLLALVVRLAAVYTSASPIGIDIWTHRELAESILQAGSLEAIADDKHYVAPLYHLLVVSTALFADLSLTDALAVSLGLAVPASAVFVYAATRFVVAPRWALLAAALYAMGDYVIEWGIHLIPTSMGLLFFSGVVYTAVRVMQTEYRTRDFLLLVLLTVAIVFTHQVSSFVMLVFIGAGVLAQYVLDRDLFRVSPLRTDVFRTMGPVNLIGLAVFDFGLLTFLWSFTPYKGDSFLSTIGSFLVETVLSSAGFLRLANPSSSPGGGGGGPPTFVETLATYVDTVGLLLLLGATFVGCLYVLRRSRAKHSVFTLVFATAIMTVFVFGLPLFGIRNFIPQRWFAFMYVPMAILSAVGVRFLAGRLSPRTFLVGLLLFALVFPGFMVTSSNGAIDSPVFQDERARLSYTAPEVAAVETIGEMTAGVDHDAVRADEMVYTDHPYQTVFERTDAYPSDVAVVTDDRPVTADVTVYREYQSDGASFFLNEDERGQLRNVPRSRVCRPGQSTLYTNGHVDLCVG